MLAESSTIAPHGGTLVDRRGGRSAPSPPSNSTTSSMTPTRRITSPANLPSKVSSKICGRAWKPGCTRRKTPPRRPVPAPKGAEVNDRDQLSPTDPTATVKRRPTHLTKIHRNMLLCP